MTSVLRRPSPRRQNTLLTTLLLLALLFSSLYYIMQPLTTEERKFVEAKEVPVSEVTRGYAAGEYEEILVKDKRIFITKEDGTLLTSFKGLESISDLGWNDPKNPTIVVVKNTDAENMLLALLPDLLFFLLVVGGLFWLFRNIARSQNTALGFGKSRARIADATTVNTTFEDVAGCDEAKEELVEVVDFLKHRLEPSFQKILLFFNVRHHIQINPVHTHSAMSEIYAHAYTKLVPCAFFVISIPIMHQLVIGFHQYIH